MYDIIRINIEHDDREAFERIHERLAEFIAEQMEKEDKVTYIDTEFTV